MKKLFLLILIIMPLFACGSILTTTVEEQLDYMYKIENKEATIISLYDNHNPNVVIPDKIKKYPVTKIENNACKNFKNLKSIEFPSTITSIGSNVLTGCINLEKLTVTFTEEASYLKYFFGGMDENALIPETLKEVNISFGCAKIYPDAFYGALSIEKIIIPSSVTEIGARAFKSCPKLKSIEFLGDLALTNLDSTAIDIERLQENITIDEKIMDSTLIPVIIVNSVVSQAYKNFFEDKFGSNVILNIYRKDMVINDFLIDGDTLVKYLGVNQDIVIPNDIRKIGKYAFSNNDQILNVTLNELLIEIEEYAFYECVNLKNVNVNTNLLKIKDSAFSECTSLNNIILNDKLEYIGLEAFANCGSLEEITIPSSVLVMDSYVFRNSNPNLVIYVDLLVEEIPESWESDWARGVTSNVIYKDIE